MAVTSLYKKLPECGWLCRLDPEDTTGQTIDLNDGTCLKLEGDVYVWYDIDGGEMDRFERGSTDFDTWNEVHVKLRG